MSPYIVLHRDLKKLRDKEFKALAKLKEVRQEIRQLELKIVTLENQQYKK